ncbi:MAG: copper amine oxidase N-terminal domain-containing protein, partial [Clostridiales bacterium]|nr:copper amine oxidase N-terminal domain-containing protein [Clostridiales bacterium]
VNYLLDRDESGGNVMKNLLRTALFALILMSMAVGVQAAAPASNLGGVNIDPDEARTEGHISITYGDGTKEEAPYNYVALLINGSLIKGSNLVIENDRTLLPLRLVSETLGAEVGWDGAARKVTILDAGNLIELVIGDTMAKVGGKSVALDVAPKIFNDYTESISQNSEMAAEKSWRTLQRRIFPLPRI